MILITEGSEDLQLPIANLRSQTYDEAANTTGIQRGYQALAREKQQLALHFYSGANCVNLVAQNAMAAGSNVHDATLWRRELRVRV